MGARAWPFGGLCPGPDCEGCGTRFAQTVLAPQLDLGTGAQPRPQALPLTLPSPAGREGKTAA